MPSQTNERALEAAIEKYLTGACLEDLKETGDASHASIPYRAGNGYYLGFPSDFSAQFALDERRFWHFLENTQPQELSKLQKDPDWKRKVLERFDRLVKKYGILYLLRKGLDIEDAHFNLLY
ncbi:MAG: hypothetical protein IT219_04070, partial [Bacteroidales bacterium]|nr:hypothetical protein [Bacteroidales bacterium]